MLGSKRGVAVLGWLFMILATPQDCTQGGGQEELNGGAVERGLSRAKMGDGGGWRA